MNLKSKYGNIYLKWIKQKVDEREKYGNQKLAFKMRIIIKYLFLGTWTTWSYYKPCMAFSGCQYRQRTCNGADRGAQCFGDLFEYKNSGKPS